MPSDAGQPMTVMTWRAPAIVLVIAATAMPIEWRPLGQVPLSFGLQFSDLAANVAGYVPVGIVLGEWGALRAIAAAASISVLAEASQFVMMHRDPSAVDVGSNVVGAIVGLLLCAMLKIRSPTIAMTRSRAAVALALALLLALGVWSQSGEALSARGSTSPGTLEGYWKLDEGQGGTTMDSSGRVSAARLAVTLNA